MSEEDLKQRLAYFEERLEEATRKSAAKEPHPPTFDAGYTTEVFKSWPESIALINDRIASIKFQMRAKQPNLIQPNRLRSTLRLVKK